MSYWPLSMILNWFRITTKFIRFLAYSIIYWLLVYKQYFLVVLLLLLNLQPHTVTSSASLGDKNVSHLHGDKGHQSSMELSARYRVCT